MVAQPIPDTRSSAMLLLLKQYLAGRIADTAWNAFMHACDMEGRSQDEQHALAAFFSDAVTDLGDEAVKAPQGDEVEALMSAIRLA